MLHYACAHEKNYTKIIMALEKNDMRWISDFLISYFNTFSYQALLFRVVNRNGISIRTTELVKKVKNNPQI